MIPMCWSRSFAAGLAVTALLAGPSPAQSVPTPTCEPCTDASYAAYNGCSYWSIDDQNMPCPADPVQPGLSQLSSANPRFSYRFTLSTGSSTQPVVDSVRLHFATSHANPPLPPRFRLSIRKDSATRPGRPAAGSLTSVDVTPTLAQATGWQQFAVPHVTLTSGTVYHIVLEYLDGDGWLELTVARGRFPVRYRPADASGTSLVSPCDRWLALMRPDAQVGWMVVAGANQGYTPVFALDLEGFGLFGVPYDQQLERSVYLGLQYGQAISVTSPTTVNYLCFWTRAMGTTDSHPEDGCIGYCNPIDPTCNPHPLNVSIVSSSSPVPPLRTTTVPVLAGFHRGRSHWYGAFFDTPVTLQPGTLYYLMMSSPLSDPTTGNFWDGWVFSAANSTIATSSNLIPTFQGDLSYAVESVDGGQTFDALTTTPTADTAFALGYFPGAQPSLGSLCDHDVSLTGFTTYVGKAQTNTHLTFTANSRNSGGSASRQYMRFVDIDCQGLSPINFGVANPPPNADVDTGHLDFIMPAGDVFGMVEFGHEDPANPSTLVRDQLFPFEVLHY